MISYKPLQDASAFRLYCKAIDMKVEQYDTVAKMVEAFGDFKVCYILDDAYITEEPIDTINLSLQYGCLNKYTIENDIKSVFKGEYKKIVKG